MLYCAIFPLGKAIMMTINNVISIKSFYRFVEFTSKLCGSELSHEKYKLISLDIIKAESKEERDVKSLCDAYQYILNNINQPFSSSVIKNAFFLLCGEVFESKYIDKILDCFYRYINSSYETRVINIQRLITRLDIKRKIEFAFILSNFIMIKCARNPLIPYSFTHEPYLLNLAIDDEERWYFLISQMEDKDRLGQEITITKEEIVERVSSKIDVIKSNFKVNYLALYGSVVKELLTSSSDIDFLVSFENDLIDLEKGKYKEQLKSYLKGLLNSEVDLIYFEHALKNLDIAEMENVIVFIR